MNGLTHELLIASQWETNHTMLMYLNLEKKKKKKERKKVV
jgi:hypothetical protein